MSHTVSSEDTGISGRSIPLIWKPAGVAAALVIFALIRFGPGTNPTHAALTLPVSAITYLGMVYLYCGLTIIVVQKRLPMFVTSAVVATIVGYLLCRPEFRNLVWIELGMITISSLTVGLLLQRGKAQAFAFTTGAFLVAIAGMIWTVSQWQIFIEGLRILADAMASSAGLAGSLSAELSPADIQLEIERFFALLTHLIPSVMTLNLLVQYGIGILLLTYVVGPRWYGWTKPVNFVRWKMPFWPMTAIVPLLALRQIGGETATMIADNSLLLVLFPYAITGLSIFEYLLRHWKISTFLKVILYLALIPAGLIGMGAIIFLGLCDSFFDWRGRIESEDKLNKEM